MKIYIVNYIWEYWKALSLKGAGGTGSGIGLGVLEHSALVSEFESSSCFASLSSVSDRKAMNFNGWG